MQTRTAQLLVCIVVSEDEEANAMDLPTVLGPRSKTAATANAAAAAELKKVRILQRMLEMEFLWILG